MSSPRSDQETNVFFSVILPTYNSADTVLQCLESLARQDFESFEVVIIDDGSGDRTLEVVEAFLFDGRLSYQILKQPNQGPAKARNVAADAARGEWLAFVDSDDYWAANKLSLQAAAISDDPDCGLVYTGGYFVRGQEVGEEELEPYFPDPAFSGHCYDVIRVFNRLVTSSVVLRRDLFLQLGGFDTSLRTRSDWELWIRVAKETSFLGLEDPLTYHALRPTSISSDSAQTYRDHRSIIECHLPAGADDRLRQEALFQFHLAYAWRFYGSHAFSSAIKEVSRALRLTPSSGQALELLLKSLVKCLLFSLARRTG